VSLLGDKSGGLIFIVVLYSVKVALGVRADGSGATAYTKTTVFFKKTSHQNKTAGHQSYIFIFVVKHHNISVVDNEILKPVYSNLKERRIHIIIDVFSSRLIS